MCMPGEYWRAEFISGLSETLVRLSMGGFQVMLSTNYIPIVSTSRNMVAGGNYGNGKLQKPFGGKVEYNYLLWLDSDISFKFDHVARLIELDKDFCAGWYKTKYRKDSCVCVNQDFDQLDKTGLFDLLSSEEIEKKKAPFKADFVGMGFVLMKKGVIEKLEYPWFTLGEHTLSNGVRRQLGEDVTFCMKIRDAGFDIWVDPTVKVGHSKTYVI